MDLQDLDDMDDPRQVEVNTMAAIFPEMKLIQTASDHVAAYTITLQIPVDPIRPVTVHFAAATNTEGSDLADNTTAVQGDDRMVGAGGRLDSHQLTHLPPVHIKIDLGADYPAEKPPSVSLSTSPPWLPHATLRQLEDDGPRLWEEMGRDAVVYSYIDHVQLSAEDVFGLVDGDGGLEVDAQHKIAMLDYDNKAKKAAFERGTYDCGVCLDPKKGTVCHRMMDCGHVFCVECLQSFYNDAISEGSITAVRCLDPFCTREREKVANAEDAAAGRKPKAQKRGFLISPSELLQIPLGQDTVKRYVTLKYKTELEADRNTIYCPRQWCNGAARSKRHKKPQGLEFSSHSGDEKPGVSDEDDDFEEDTAAENLDISNKQGENGATHSPTEKLCKARVAICEDCGFAFCVRCSQSWHGEFVRCRRKPGEIDEDERATLEYMKLHTTACPTCAASAQKTHGCNHMICARCNTHFCYLCASWLDPYNPYGHFNEDHEGRRTGCYMRLWELEFGDGAGAGYANGLAGGPLPAALVPAPIPRPVAGGDAPAVAAAPPLPIRPIPEIEEVEGQDAEPVARRAAREVVAAPGLGRQVDVAREGPLVLRIAGNGNQPAGAGRGGPRVRAAAAPPIANGFRRGGVVAQAQPPPQNQIRYDNHNARGGIPMQPMAGGGGRREAAARGGGGGGGRVPPRQRGGLGAQGQRLQGGRNHVVADNDRGEHDDDNDDDEDDIAPLDGILDPMAEAWIRQFVQLALNDEEGGDEGDGDLDELLVGW